MKNSNDIIGNRTRDLLVSSAVPQPTVPPRAPVYWLIYLTNTPFTTIPTFIRFIYNQLTPDKQFASFPILVRFTLGRDSTVGVPTGIHAGKPTNHVSILGRDKSLLSSVKRRNRLSGQPSRLFGGY
jgi:hypothetical protein